MGIKKEGDRESNAVNKEQLRKAPAEGRAPLTVGVQTVSHLGGGGGLTGSREEKKLRWPDGEPHHTCAIEGGQLHNLKKYQGREEAVQNFGGGVSTLGGVEKDLGRRR